MLFQSLRVRQRIAVIGCCVLPNNVDVQENESACSASLRVRPRMAVLGCHVLPDSFDVEENESVLFRVVPRASADGRDQLPRVARSLRRGGERVRVFRVVPRASADGRDRLPRVARWPRRVENDSAMRSVLPRILCLRQGAAG